MKIEGCSGYVCVFSDSEISDLKFIAERNKTTLEKALAVAIRNYCQEVCNHRN